MPVAFFAVVSIGVVGLYVAYVTPVYLRWRKGDDFKPGAWTLGDKYKWVNPIAVGWVVLTTIYFMLPFYGPPAVFWDDAFDWNAVNFTPLVMGGLLIAITARMGAGHEQALHGPDPHDRVRRGDGDQGGEAARSAASARRRPPDGHPRERPCRPARDVMVA